jgi:hypothetical protein
VGCRAARPSSTNARRPSWVPARTIHHAAWSRSPRGGIVRAGHPSSSSSLFGCQRTLPPCAARTSGLDASADVAGAPGIVLRPRASRGAAVSTGDQESRLQIKSGYFSVVVSRTGLRKPTWALPKARWVIPTRPKRRRATRFPWAALQHGDVVHVIRVGGPQDRRRTEGLRRIRRNHDHNTWHYALLASWSCPWSWSWRRQRRRQQLPAVGYVGASSS